MNPHIIQWLFRANISFFALLIPILFEFSPPNESRFFRLATSILLLTIIFVLPSLNITALLSKITKRGFDLVEFCALSITIALLFVPLILCIQADVFNILFPELPLVTSTLSFLLFVLFFRNAKHSYLETAPHATANSTHSYGKALMVSLVIITTTIVGIVTAYYPLPDLDPYYWVTIFQDQFAKGVISSLSSHRPLFSSLTYLFNQSASVDLYAFFKYLIPFFALSPLIPAILIARRFSSFVSQLVIFLIPLVNASFFLYTTLPIPQSIFNSLLTIAIIFTLYSLLTETKVYFYLTGVILLFGFFFHEMAIIPIIAWLIAFLVKQKTAIIQFTKQNQLATGLILALILSNFSFLSHFYSFALNWSMRITTLIIHARTNFYFPAQYINIDGNNVGWQGTWGIIQYYGYYFGPASLLIILLLPFIIRNPRIWTLLKKQEALFLIASLLLFFTISDVLPRLFNIALLPERALGFVSLFLIAFVPLIFIVVDAIQSSWQRLLPYTLLLALFINLGGALYINSLKKHLISPAQLQSAQWIQANLPKNRIIFSADNHRLLTFYSESTVVEISDPQLYFNKNIFEQYHKSYIPKNTKYEKSIRSELKNISDSIADLANKQSLFDNNFILALRAESTQLTKLSLTLEEKVAPPDAPGDKSPKQYIYFAAPSSKNPYADRPYMKALNIHKGPFIFDQYPQQFRMIYSDTENAIYLWEIL